MFWTAGCSPSEPAVATATVDLSRDSVSVGSPVDIGIRFDVLEAIPVVQEDYEVLLHVLDANGDLLWAMDHQPVIPTSEWQVGQSVAYNIREKIPLYPYVGEVAVAIGLYSLVTGERLTLSGNDLGQRSYPAATFLLNPQDGAEQVVYLDGWYQAEFQDDGRNRWRWMGDRAVLGMRNPRGAARLYLELQGRPDLFDRPQRVSLSIGGRTLFEGFLGTEEVVFVERELLGSDFGSTDDIALEIHVDQTFVLSGGLAEGSDERELGIRVFYAYLRVL